MKNAYVLVYYEYHIGDKMQIRARCPPRKLRKVFFCNDDDEAREKVRVFRKKKRDKIVREESQFCEDFRLISLFRVINTRISLRVIRRRKEIKK